MYQLQLLPYHNIKYYGTVCYRYTTFLNDNGLSDEHLNYKIPEFINYMLAKSKNVNDAIRNEWFYRLKQLFQQVRFFFSILFVEFS